MQPESPAPKPRRNWHLVRWTFLFAFALLGWYGWKAYDFRQAVKEADALGWSFSHQSPITIIRKDWKAAFRKETWRASVRALWIGADGQLEHHFDVIRRLDTTHLTSFAPFPLRDLSELRGNSNLIGLQFFDCPKLTNIETLRDMKGLRGVSLNRAPNLANIDALKELKNLEYLGMHECTALTNLDALRELKSLKHLSIKGCTGLKNVDGVLGLTGLEVLVLRGCSGLTDEAIAAVKAALPKTDVGSMGLEPLTRRFKSDTPDKK